MSNNNSGKNVVQLHIDQEALPADRFMESVRSFIDMIQALAQDASPSLGWMVSVEKGSTCLNADLVSEDVEAVPDVKPALKVIRGGLEKLTSGRGIETVPEKARKSYFRLVSAVEHEGDGEHGAQLVLTADDDRSDEVLPIKRHVAEGTVSKPSTYPAVGSVTGRLYSLNSRSGNNFIIANESTGLAVRGRFGDDLKEDFKRAFDDRATVAGIIEYGADGRVKNIVASSVAVEPKDAPKMSELRGTLGAMR